MKREENSVQCALCETMRPESKAIRKGGDWVCKSRTVCSRAAKVRNGAAKTDEYVYGWRKDYWGRA